MQLDLTNCFVSTTETRAQLLARLNDFSIAPGINTEDFTQKVYDLAVIDNRNLGRATVNGQAVPAECCVVAVLQVGDANADGAVTLDDYTLWQAGRDNASDVVPNAWEYGAFNGQTDPVAPVNQCPNYLAWAAQFLIA